MNICAVIQARMGSTRLPGKVMKKIGGYTVLEHVIKRVQLTTEPTDVIVATGRNKKNRPIVRLCKRLGVECIQGPEDDVLKRYFIAAINTHADWIVRICADSPLIDPMTIDRCVRKAIDEDCWYCSNTLNRTFPDGLDVEVFSMSTLAAANFYAFTHNEREHVTPHMIDHWSVGSGEKLCQVLHDEDLSHWRWTIDTLADLVWFRKLAKTAYFKPPYPTFGYLMSLMKAYPEYVRTQEDTK